MLNKRQKVILALIKQHRGLQKTLGMVLESANSKGSDRYSVIEVLLRSFKKDLLRHLEDEKRDFYDVLIQTKELPKEKVEAFTVSMEKIGVSVIQFLEKYNTEAAIESAGDDFIESLEYIVHILNSRIAAEESGIYSYWATIDVEIVG